MWPRLRAVCTADLTYRMEQFADGGLARVLANLHPDVAFADDLLQTDKPHHCSHRFDLAGGGMVLVPCAFTWPSLSVDCCGADQPVLIYPPRGLAELWRDPGPEQADPLAALLGLSPASVSEHLKILKDAALVTARRRGRMVLYQRTAAATALLAAVRTDRATG